MEDKLPKMLCTACYHKICDFKKFQNMCLASDRHLRQLNEVTAIVISLDDEIPLYVLETVPDENKLKLIHGQTKEITADVETKTNSVRSQRHRVCNKSVIEIPNVAKESKLVFHQAKPSQLNDTNARKVYKCHICPKRFLVEHRLIAHKRSHKGLAPYSCTKTGCDKGFNRLCGLTEHLKQHEGTSDWYTCDQAGCDKSYKHKTTLIMHLRKYHNVGSELKMHMCEICGKIFKSATNLNDHRYTHKEQSELPYACEEAGCQRRFSNRGKRKMLMLRHAGIRNFACPYCGLRKTTRNELKIHINYHTLERQWPCRFCSKVCNSGNLKLHIRTVHEQCKDYTCRYCERTFGKQFTLKYHEMTHTGEKPHACAECGKHFTQPAALRTHRKVHLRQAAGITAIFTTDCK